MIYELADIQVKPEDHAAFAAVLKGAVDTVLSRSEGYLAHRVMACQETPGRYVLLVEWASLEAHTVGFRASPAFAQWRALIGPYFAKPPHVEHFDEVARSSN